MDIRKWIMKIADGESIDDTIELINYVEDVLARINNILDGDDADADGDVDGDDGQEDIGELDGADGADDIDDDGEDDNPLAKYITED